MIRFQKSKLLWCGLCLLGILFSVSLQAQSKTRLNGMVSSEEGEPLNGVSVTITATGGKEKKSLVTNEKGVFTVDNLKAGQKYDFNFTHVGYEQYQVKAFEIKAGINNSMIIRMKAAASSLNDVVVIGYGAVKRKDVTGAIGSVDGEQLQEVATGDVTQALQGRVSGVLVQTQSWKPGEMAQVRIRGARSFNASNDPLYVVDGIPFMDAINQISPNDIESIQVLKDASATAIYGNRGANGVILITTKKGKAGKTTVDYNGYYGAQDNKPLPRLMNAAEFVEYSREAQRNSLGGTYDPTPNKDLDFQNEQLIATEYMYENMTRAWESGTYDASKLISTDWLSYGLRSGAMQDHQLSVRGGDENTRFMLSADYFDNVGVVKDQDYSRYSIRLNAEQKIARGVRIGTQTLFSHSLQDAGWSDIFSGYGLKSFNPLASPYEMDGVTLALYPTNNTRTPNPVTNFGNTRRVRKNDRFLGNYFAEVSFLNDFTFRTNLGIDYRAGQTQGFDAANTASAGGEAPARATNATSRKFMYTVENILSYNKTIAGNHSIYATLVQSVQEEKSETNSISVENLPYEEQLYYNVGSALTIDGVSSNFSKWNLASFMGRLNYGFKDKYLATVSARYDGSSLLATGKKWVMFPSVALAWRLSKEPFLKSAGALSDLKLRLGWGRTGNAFIDPYKTWGSLSIVRYVWGDDAVLGFAPNEMINPNLTWETTDQYNTGLDFGLWDNRITGSLEVYLQNTHDLLLDRQLPTVSGFDHILANVGKTRNKGVELSLHTVNVSTKNFEWKTDWMFSANKQEIVELYNGKQDDVGAEWFIGQPVHVYYELGFNGIWQGDDKDAADMQKFNDNGATFKAGDIRPLDLNGDYKIDASDRYIRGQQDPKWTASWSSNFRYKNFDASIFLNAMVGQTIYHDLDMRFDGRYNQPNLNYWTPDNPSKEYPRPLLGTAEVNYLSTLYYYNGSFLRVKNISVGYSLPQTMIQRTPLQKFRVYASVQNPFLITNFPGTDPEGASGFNEPSVVTYLVGVNISL